MILSEESKRRLFREALLYFSETMAHLVFQSIEL